MERERTREADAEQLTDYDRSQRYKQELLERQKTGKLLIRGEDRQFQMSRQGILKYYLNAVFTDTAVSSWSVFEHLIKRQSGRHKHQGGIIIYVLEGHGTTETSGELLEWQAGDLLLLPIQRGGTVHQHWNKDASKGCRWVAFRDLLIGRCIANITDQVSEIPDKTGSAGTTPQGTPRKGWKATANVDQVPLVSNPGELASLNLFDRLMALRDLQRNRLQQSTWLIRGDELSWELNAHGKMQWFLHPCLAYTAVHTHLCYRQEIPVGSRSGLQRHGGDAVFYMLEGEGFTEVDGIRHAWKAGDVMTLPVFPDGVLFRHVNSGTTPVRLICVERDLSHITGVDRHCGFEQLQPCPEFREASVALRQ